MIKELYAPPLKEEYFDAILLPIAELLREKNHDYGNSYDHLRDRYGLVAFLVRVADKMSRLESINEKGAKVKDETAEDTIKDIIGYCTLELNYRRKQQGR